MNAAGRILDQLHIEPVTLEKEALIAKAIQRAGCSDFGDSGFHEGLDRLLDSFENESRLTLLGRLMAQGTVIERLQTRLKLIEWRKQHPAGFVPRHSLTVAPDDSACGNKRHCSEMTSCEEARHYLTKCGIETMDGDGDGVPCEALCAPQ